MDAPSGSDARMETREKQKKLHDRRAKELPELKSGTRVCVQNPSSGAWDSYGTVIDSRESGSLVLDLDNGKTVTRNRRFLRPTMIRRPGATSGSRSSPSTPTSNPTPRRSPRRKCITFAECAKAPTRRGRSSSKWPPHWCRLATTP